MLHRAPLHDQLPGDTGQRPGAQRGCDDRASEHQEDVAAGSLTDMTRCIGKIASLAPRSAA